MRYSVRSFLLYFSVLATTLLPAAANATYPEKPVTVIVPWVAGGSGDLLARVLAQYFKLDLGQNVIVENRSGASGNIGTADVARARPDGYTLLVGTMSTHAMNPELYANMPFDGVRDFTPIGELASLTTTLVVNASVPVSNVAELIAYARDNPNKLAYATAGAGSINQIGAAMFVAATGVRMVDIAYRGGAPAVFDTVANRTQVLFGAGTLTLPYVQSGKLKLLAVTEPRRSPLLPNVPTVSETVKGYDMSTWWGVLGPKGMDPTVVAQLNNEINKILARPDVIQKLKTATLEPRPGTPEMFARTLAADAAKYSALIKTLHMEKQ
jgi:tripartite-type tricarboxylate transporter receptor subunit TctC